MAYGYPYQQPTYFNTNYMPPQQMPMQQMPTAPQSSITTVRSEMEARQSPIPMDGSMSVYHNPDAGEIYTKRLSMEDGSIRFDVYRRTEAAPVQQPEYATMEYVRALEARIEALGGAKK